MTIRQQGGTFGRNPSFNDVSAETMDGGNFVKQAYEYAKTLPEYDDAADVK